ncbi:hypothetical protein O6H91_10G055700 [Diphasiastrum complanatum]|uniref:Uncharacterized protein n=1 Tax=Diphasiastrum complanatum TaxID=34168 RepID=A0ACC2CH82_DIPCM|nr:hypothetical protein O6H91_10G055700 [Diphasiastrum complanatum]
MLSAAWLCLVFSAKRCCFHRLQLAEDVQELLLSPPIRLNWPRDDEMEDATFKAAIASAWTEGNVGSMNLSVHNIVFGVAGTVSFWPNRKELIKLWWKPPRMRGFVWLEESVPYEKDLPLVMVSEDTSRFSYTNAFGRPTGIRIARIILETFKLRIPDVNWFVLCDDDTIFSVENLVRVLNKYDSSQLYYIGSTSESHGQNLAFNFNMAYGGGGFAISYALAEALVKMLDNCLERYPELFGSDDRIHACISELGVPLTREPGFHQCDIMGNAMGLLAAHPVAPFVSLHHVEVMEPLLPGHTLQESLRLLTKAMRTEPGSFLQQSICYDQEQSLSYSVSTGYVVQVYPEILYPSRLERVEVTFRAWNERNGLNEFDQDTRESKGICRQPYLFYIEGMQYQKRSGSVISNYKRDLLVDHHKRYCWSRLFSLDKVQRIRVQSEPLTMNWYKVPRRQCCKVASLRDGVLNLRIQACQPGEIIAL